MATGLYAQPAALDLLSWAIEEAAAECNLYVGDAWVVLDEFQYLNGTQGPAVAVTMLFQLEDMGVQGEEGPFIIHN